MSKLTEAMLVTALQQALNETPLSVGVYKGRNIGALLEKALNEAGYNLELHQHGIGGTSIIAVKHEDVTLDIPTA